MDRDDGPNRKTENTRGIGADRAEDAMAMG
jgi:hypothetical protein